MKRREYAYRIRSEDLLGNTAEGWACPEHGGYLGLGLAYNMWLYRMRKKVLERALRRFPIVSEKTSLLEVAPGSGFYLPSGARTVSAI